jgi:hypothetical protein
VISVTNATEVRSVVRIEAAVEDFLTDKGKGQRGESGNSDGSSIFSSSMRTS